MLEQHPDVEPAWQSTRLPLSDESLITSKQLRELVGNCSEMHIWRLLNDEKYQALAFPKPIKINDRNYWRLGAVRQWICDREAHSQKVPPDNGGDGEALFVGQKRPRPVASRKQSRLSKRAGRSRARAS